MGRMREINMEFTCFQPTISRKVDISALRGVVDIVEPVTSRIAARSLTEATYAALRSDVITGRVPPGTRLPAAQIASERGISLNVVREALNRLAGEGLVIASPQQGFATAELTAEDLEDLAEVRILVETEALRKSMRRGGLSWESELVAAHYRLARTPMTTPQLPPEALSVEWMTAHSAFHLATMSGCGSDRLMEIAERLSESAAIYRYRARMYDLGKRDVAAEHQAIMNAVVARDVDLACRLHTEHLRRTVRIAGAARHEVHAFDRSPDGSST